MSNSTVRDDTALPTLLQKLLRPEAYSNAGANIELVETHISWVLLTGTYAYKIKKPVNMGFLDFTDLNRRLHFCQEEIRLNSRTAPDLYLGVVPITGTPEAPRVEGDGEILEYAVKMRQFDQKMLLSHQLENSDLQCWQVDSLAEQMANLHAAIPRAVAEDGHGTLAEIHGPALQNFEVLEQSSSLTRRCLEKFAELRVWTEQEFERLAPLMKSRKRDGYVRECHGDLHLGNVTQIGDRIVPFDGIEFNESFRWIDVMSEVAFLFTDLEHRGRRELGWRVLSRYLEGTGDFGGLSLLAYYRLYRIMVRAKVDVLRLRQSSVSIREHQALKTDIDRYLSQAQSTIKPRTRALILTRGICGSGKDYVSRNLLEALGAIRLRFDVERAKLGALSEKNDRESEESTCRRLLDLSAQVLQAGYPAVVEGCFLDPGSIAPFRALAVRQGYAFRVVDLRAPGELVREHNEGHALDPARLAEQIQHYHPLDDPYCVPLTSYRDLSGQELLDTLRLKG